MDTKKKNRRAILLLGIEILGAEKVTRLPELIKLDSEIKDMEGFVESPASEHYKFAVQKAAFRLFEILGPDVFSDIGEAEQLAGLLPLKRARVMDSYNCVAVNCAAAEILNKEEMFWELASSEAKALLPIEEGSDDTRLERVMDAGNETAVHKTATVDGSTPA